MTCCGMDGQVWQFTDDAVLEEPFGIDIDNNDNVYVADRALNNIVVISADGKLCKEILSEDDGLDYL